ncbi:MAG: cysteine synthase family protein [Planctomycetota bacterium]
MPNTINHELSTSLGSGPKGLAPSRTSVADLALPATPIVPVNLGRGAIWCKLEYLNPSGSVNDRIAVHMLLEAIRLGHVENKLVVEASSGSTAVAMAMVCARLGLKFVAFMPDGVSRERLVAIKAYGGEFRKTDPSEGMRGSLLAAQAFAREHGAFETKQFENPQNADAHRLRTATELIGQCPGRHLDAFVSGVGTGGTLMGVGTGLREFGLDAKLYAAKPIARNCSDEMNVGSVEQCSFSARIPGVLDGFSTLYQPDAIEGGIEEIEVDDTVALQRTHDLLAAGFPVGPSSGLNFAAAEQVVEKLGPDARVTTVLCDRVERYFSTDLFAEHA